MFRSSPLAPHFLITFALLAAAVGGCQQEPEAADGNAASNPIVNLPSVARPDPPLDREGLLAAVAQAASATAAGAAASADLRGLDGRQFELRIRFGCRGPSTDLRNEWLGWSIDPETRTVRLQARPTISAKDPLVQKLSQGQFEAVEGFWIPRPWLLQPVCPATAAIEKPADKQKPGEADEQTDQRAGEPNVAEQESEPVPTAPRIGIAQFFTSTDARTGRRDGRPYQALHTLPEGAAIGSQGFNLVLAGRLRALPGRQVIECIATNAARPPECIVSADFQRAWIEQPENREIIAEWGGG